MAGQIISRGKDKWLVRVFVARDEDGHRKYHNKTITGNKKAAQAYLNSVLRDKDMGTFREPSKETLNKYLNQWLTAAVKARVKEKTYRSYEEVLRLYIRPILGDTKIAKLSPIEIQAVYNTLGEKGLSARTVRYAHSVLRNALEQAVRWQMIPQNPILYVDLPRQQKVEMHALSPKEARRFLEAASYSKLQALFILMVTTGLRPGEALGLQWQDVDFDQGRIHVQHSLSRTKDVWRLEEPKTPRSRRSIPLPKSVVLDLKAHRKGQAEEKLKAEQYDDYGFVFAASNGQPLHERNIVRREFKPLLKIARLPDTIRLYDLRHTCATLLLAAGENPKVVSERLGHASVTLTLDTYSHVLPDMQRGAADKLEEMLFGQDILFR
ncbi:MAG: tyrosine-type recombinase/integrase [Bacillota bacterium]